MAMAMAWGTRLDAYPSFTTELEEETGDSEEVGFDRIRIDGAHNVDEDHDLNDDAMSCSCDSWDAICDNEFTGDDVGDSESGYGDAGWACWAMSVTDKESPTIVAEEEKEEEEDEGGVVDGFSRNAIEAMEDKDFWEACLAVGY